MSKNLLQNPVILEYLMDSPFYEVIDDLLAKHAIGEDRRGELYDVTDAVINGQLPLVELPIMVAQAFGLDADKAQKLAVDLAGHRLLPLEIFLPGIADQIIAWGGKVEDYPADRLTKTELSAGDIVSRLVDSLLEDHGMQLPDAMKNRLSFLLQGYLSGDRDAEATKAMFMRGANIGGLELTDEVAVEVLSQVDTLRGKVDVVDEVHEETSSAAKRVLGQEASEKDVIEGTYVTAGGREEVKGSSEVRSPKNEERSTEIEGGDQSPSLLMEEGAPSNDAVTVRIASTDAVTLRMKSDEGSVPVTVTLEGESKEIKDQRSESQGSEHIVHDAVTVRPERVKMTEQLKPKPLEQQKPVAKPAKPSNLPAKSVTHALAKEVPVISGSLVNDAERREIEVHEKRTAPHKKMEQDQAYEEAASAAYSRLGNIVRSRRMTKVDFVALAVAHIRGLKDPLRTEEQLGAKHGFSEDQVDQVMAALEQARTDVQNKGGQIKDQRSEKKERTDFSKQERDLLDQRHASMTRRVTNESINPVLPGARVSASRSKQDELDMQSGNLDGDKIQQAQVASKPKKAMVKVSQSTAPRPDEGKLVDVQYKKRLIGPVDELGAMSTEEFRRLSNDANQAIQKIIDQLDVLKMEDYGQYIAGVKSWRKSPMNQLYIQMTQDALNQGIALTEIASQRRNKGEESLSPMEVKALMTLNGKLRF